MRGSEGAKSPYPPGFTRVQYLYLDGTGTISLETEGSEETDAFELDFQRTVNTSNMRLVTSTSMNCQMYVTGSGRLGWTYNGTWMNYSAYLVSTSHRIAGIDYVNKKAWIAAGNTTWTGSSTKTTDGAIMTIGGAYGNNARFTGYVFGFKYWRNGVNIRDLHMLRDANNNPFVFDMANGVFREVTGGVTVGPDF